MNHYLQNWRIANWLMLWKLQDKLDDVTVIASRVEVKDNNGLRQMMDEMKQKLSKGVIVLRNCCQWKVCLLQGLQMI